MSTFLFYLTWLILLICLTFLYLEITRDLQPRARRLLLILNPYGGRGNSLQQCHTHILPMITEADISYNLVQTGAILYNANCVFFLCNYWFCHLTNYITSFLLLPERQNHARELVQTINLKEWDGIVVISGDGVLFEVISTFAFKHSLNFAVFVCTLQLGPGCLSLSQSTLIYFSNRFFIRILKVLQSKEI